MDGSGVNVFAKVGRVNVKVPFAQDPARTGTTTSQEARTSNN